MKKLLIILTLLFVVSCEQSKKGIVVEKEYTPSRVFMVSTPVGKSVIYVPCVYPEVYTVTIKGKINNEYTLFYKGLRKYEKAPW